MAPRGSSTAANNAGDGVPRTWRLAAGLLLVFPADRAAHIVLTVRASTLPRHRGQVSLPGGVIESGETIEQAALREAAEEIGLDPHHVQTIGRLTAVDITVSSFRLTPVVALAASRPTLRPAAREVARILEVPVGTLLDRRTLGWAAVQRPDGERLTVPAFRVDGEVIWGATGMVLAEFLAVLGGKIEPDSGVIAEH